MTNFSNPDERTLWLEAHSPDVAGVLGARAALRAVPAGNRASRGAVLGIFRRAATSWAWASFPDHRGELGHFVRAVFSGSTNAHEPITSEAANFPAAGAVDETNVRLRAYNEIGHAISAARSSGGAFEATLHAIAADAAVLDREGSSTTLAAKQLWPERVPNWARNDWARLKQRLLGHSEDWHVWVDWYEERLLGKQPDQALELARATIPDDVWRRGAKVVNARIRQLIEDYPSSPKLPSTGHDDPPPDPINEDAFKRWLLAKPRSWSVAIAARAALRVVPLYDWTVNNDVLRIFHAVAISRLAVLHQTSEAAKAAKVVADIGFNSGGTILEAASRAAAAAFTTNPADAIAAVAAALRVAGDQHDISEAVLIDARSLHQGFTMPGQLAGAKLWYRTARSLPSGLSNAWLDLVMHLQGEADHWRVWIDWYNHVLEGSPQNEAWEAAFTDVSGPLRWHRGPTAVNIEIATRLERIEIQAKSIPDQSPAPVRVEERNGKIAQVSDRGSPLRAAERDFDAWREPVIDHLRELLSSDFQHGTNHSRIRDRLVALGNLLTGQIDDAKERQFRIGYEIERLDGLIAAYRSSADDMPNLNAAALEDLDRLRGLLKIGISKLERWTEFHRGAADDPVGEGDADPDVVGEALEQLAAGMEEKQKYFNPELPATFRFLAEAVKDRTGATKTVIYGAVKSIENLISFLAQRAIGIGKKTGDAVEEHLSKGVAAAIILGFGGVALRLSEALPHGWAWLKPLLEALARTAGGG